MIKINIVYDDIDKQNIIKACRFFELAFPHAWKHSNTKSDGKHQICYKISPDRTPDQLNKNV